ncbi:hypothetical protein [Microvirga sp. CF3016]|uniref:hypothetical protein n=1 Tax=Microvirga sp. CF3016 TaxID=3110181 RepID=UPI002E78B74B|nr:hypothetical protein [Microvirga sp. CF3016]MEE1612299.1 hypothetical protein [Microvirga sp. CF3016]
MIKAATEAAALAMLVALAACNQTGAGSVALGTATGLDPTGLSGTAVSLVQSAQPERDPDPQSIDFSQFASRLSDVAAGNTARPNYLSGFDRQAGLVTARQAAGIAQTVGGAAIDGALTGGIGAVGAAPSLVMQGAAMGMTAGHMAGARAQASADIAKAEAQRAAEQVVPDADRPAEAQAILSILDGSGATSATWQNPSTGASGKVSLKSMNRKAFGELDCRLVRRDVRSGRATRTGEMLACRSKGEWYDLS